MNDEIEKLYTERFMKKDFDDACYMLYPQRYSWPPNLDDIKKEVESIRSGRVYER